MPTNPPHTTGRANPALRLGEWLNEPYIKAPVVAVLKRADIPLTLSEVAQAAGVRLGPANRVLGRLVQKGLVSRRKLPMQRHAFCRKRWEVLPYEARRMLYVYTWLSDDRAA